MFPPYCLVSICLELMDDVDGVGSTGVIGGCFIRNSRIVIQLANVLYIGLAVAC